MILLVPKGGCGGNEHRDVMIRHDDMVVGDMNSDRNKRIAIDISCWPVGVDTVIVAAVAEPDADLRTAFHRYCYRGQNQVSN